MKDIRKVFLIDGNMNDRLRAKHNAMEKEFGEEITEASVIRRALNEFMK